jgi:NADH:ubiquinone oxidoreductase subunit K
MINYVILSMTLLAIGIYGLLTRRHILKILISIEVIATAASMNFILLAPSLNRAMGETFLMLAFSTDTCVTGIVLALLIIVARKYGTADIRKLAKLEWREEVEEEKDRSEASGSDD